MEEPDEQAPRASPPRWHDEPMPPPTAATNTRMPWAEVPEGIRTDVERILGAPVVEAHSQSGGFSPGSADRVTTAAGTRAFVKTAWLAVNEHAPDIHRSEARIGRALPPQAPAPRFLGVVDAGEWVAIVVEDVEGRHPATPWRPDELETVLDGLRMLSAEPVDGALAAALQPLGPTVDAQFRGWRRLAEAPPAPWPIDRALAEWAKERLPRFADDAVAAIDDVAGDRLVHGDVRADNILISPAGDAIFVDWPWAAKGAPWFDALTVLVNVRLYDPTHDVEPVIRSHAVFDDMTSDAATRTLTGLAGFFLEAALQPPAPGIPTLRAFQRDQAIACLEWLRERGA